MTKDLSCFLLFQKEIVRFPHILMLVSMYRYWTANANTIIQYFTLFFNFFISLIYSKFNKIIKKYSEFC